MGNKAFQIEDYKKAMDCYTKAIDNSQDKPSAILHTNRASVYNKLYDAENAIQDANKAIELDKTYGKGYLRKAQALISQDNTDEARAVLKEGIENDASNNQEMKDLFELLEREHKLDTAYDMNHP